MKPSKNTLPRLDIVLLLLCVVIYGCGIYLTRAYPCQSIGAMVLLVGTAIGALSAIVAGIFFVINKSGSQALLAILIALFVGLLFFFVGVFTLPGCAGV